MSGLSTDLSTLSRIPAPPSRQTMLALALANPTYLSPTYKPGETVCLSGIYEVIHDRNHIASHR